MGLDGVMLLMAVEEQFGIAITDEESEQCQTVGQLHALIRRKVAEPRHAHASCLTQRAFHRLRLGIMQSGWASRRDIRPDGSMNSLIPKKERRANWRALAHASNLKLPSLMPALNFQGPVIVLLYVLVAVLVVGLFLGGGIPLIVIVCGIVFSLILLLHTKWAIQVCPDNLGAFCESLLLNNADRLAAGSYRWSDGEVWKLLKAIVVEQLGVPEEAVVPEARFIDDLGVG